MKITLYTIHCPKCNILQKKLDTKNIKYEIFEDQDKMIEMGLKSSPILEVDGVKYEFPEANTWVNNQKEEVK